MQALAQVRRSRSFFYEAELLRLQAIACAGRNKHPKANKLFSKALQTATAQGARALELRILLSMVRLNPSDRELRVRLREKLASFSEGLHLPDLRSAEALCRTAGALQT